MVWKLYHLIQTIVGDSALKKVVIQFKTKLSVFSQLRQALAIASESTNKGLRQNFENTSCQQLKKIKTAVESFMQILEQEIKQTEEKTLRASFNNVKERILKYWDKLFADHNTAMPEVPHRFHCKGNRSYSFPAARICIYDNTLRMVFPILLQ